MWVNDEARTDSRLAALQDSGRLGRSEFERADRRREDDSYGTPRTDLQGGAPPARRAARLGSTWHFAEAKPALRSTCSLVMMNPGAADALVEARYLLPSGERIARSLHGRTAQPRACIVDRARIRRLADTRVAVTLTSTNGCRHRRRTGRCSGLAPPPREWDEASAGLGLTSAGTSVGDSPQAKSAVRVTRGPISRWRTCLLTRLPQSRGHSALRGRRN